MSFEKVCVSCGNNTFYSSVNCKSGICNRPSCSRAVDITHPAYSEEHPKKISECNNCSGTKKTVPKQNQPTIKDFFAKK